jgi:hypothetical protein
VLAIISSGLNEEPAAAKLTLDVTRAWSKASLAAAAILFLQR